MAHKVYYRTETNQPKKSFKLPTFNGKFGVSLYIGSKEVFIGLSINPVEIEQVIKRRLVKTSKARVQVYNFEA